MSDWIARASRPRASCLELSSMRQDLGKNHVPDASKKKSTCRQAAATYVCVVPATVEQAAPDLPPAAAPPVRLGSPPASLLHALGRFRNLATDLRTHELALHLRYDLGHFFHPSRSPLEQALTPSESKAAPQRPRGRRPQHRVSAILFNAGPP